MKKRYLYLLMIALFVAASAFVFTKFNGAGKKEVDVVSQLLPRKTSLSYATEWATVKNNADVLLNKIHKKETDFKSLMQLTAIYLQEARITGQFGYYHKAATQCIDKVLANDPNNFEALTFKTTILLSDHQFEKARTLGEQVKQLYPYNAYVYGLLVDANIEMGDYDKALEAADKMVSIRPDTRSYSRIAYLREIYGDITGAIEAMQLAIDAGAPGDENTEWCRIQAGKLNEKLGKTMEAKMMCTIAADNRPDYPYALAGLARMAVVEKKFPEALALYERAYSILADHSFKQGEAEVYILTGKTAKAKEIAEQKLAYMQQVALRQSGDQNEDHEMINAWIGVGNYDKALEYARKEYNRRPGNIDVNEMMAVVYYGKGEYAKAIPYIEAALKTHCRNPELLCHAGLVYAKAGKSKEAKMLLEEGLKNNPVISVVLATESKSVLKSLWNLKV
jgi:tetratricopeptide (TPR) repeat protein